MTLSVEYIARRTRRRGALGAGGLINEKTMGAAFQRMLSSFYSRQLEVVLVGLENSGKTTLMNGERKKKRCVSLKVGALPVAVPICYVCTRFFVCLQRQRARSRLHTFRGANFSASRCTKGQRCRLVTAARSSSLFLESFNLRSRKLCVKVLEMAWHCFTCVHPA